MRIRSSLPTSLAAGVLTAAIQRGGEPIRVPPGLPSFVLQPQVERIQAEMDRLKEAAKVLSESARLGLVTASG